MSALVYLVLTGAKNSLKELRRKPGKLALYLLVIALIVMVMVMSLITRPYADADAPLFWFTVAVFLFVSLYIVISVQQALSSGSTLFGMDDVNLLFAAPIPSRNILLYGIVRAVKTAFFSCFFILFQAQTLGNMGVDFGGVLITFASVAVSILVLTVASLLIYSKTNGRAARKRAVRTAALLMYAPLAVFAALRFLNAPDIMQAAEAVITSPFLRCIPVAGWTATGVTAIVAGDIAGGLIGLGLTVLAGVLMVVYIFHTNPDYYEDVLVATETAFEARRAAAEGDLNAVTAVAINKKKAYVTRLRLRNRGAAAFFDKHALESFRESRFGFFRMQSIITVASALVFVLVVRDLFTLLMVLVWVQLFLIGTGRGLKETYSHYIYMVPDSSFRKILWSNMEVMARVLMENVLIFLPAGLILRADPLYVCVCFAVYTLYSFMLLGVNYMSMRFLRADLSIGILITAYYGLVLLVMAPGLAAAIAAGVMTGGDMGFFVGLLVMGAWELAAGLGCFALARGVLRDCDMSMMKT